MKIKKIPTDTDWRSEPFGIESNDVYNHYQGKNISEATLLFEKNFSYYSEDLLYMPKICFKYYIYSFMEFLKIESSRSEVMSPHVFFSIIESRFIDICDDDELLDTVLKTLRYLVEEKHSFGEFVDWKGDYNDRLMNCIDLLKK